MNLFKIMTTSVVALLVSAVISFAETNTLRFNNLYYSDEEQVTISFVTDGHTSSLKFDGMITEGNIDKLYDYYQEYEPDSIEIASAGGEVMTAYAFGSWIHDNNVHIVIPEGKYCLSACATIAIGDKNLDIQGVIGFHQTRFGIMDPGYTITQLGEGIVSTNAITMKYLSDLGYGMQLAFDIFTQTTASKFIAFTDISQLDYYVNNNIIVTYQEFIVAGQNMLAPFMILTNEMILESEYTRNVF